jgi:hypothetical protein
MLKLYITADSPVNVLTGLAAQSQGNSLTLQAEYGKSLHGWADFKMSDAAVSASIILSFFASPIGQV